MTITEEQLTCVDDGFPRAGLDRTDVHTICTSTALPTPAQTAASSSNHVGGSILHESTAVMSATDRVVLDQLPSPRSGVERISTATDLDLTVVIATYNRRGSVATILGDLAGQVGLKEGTASFDVIVVNDGGNIDVAAEVPTDLEFRIRVVSRTNGGPANARHSGISLADAAIVIIVDDDMRLDPGFVAAHLGAHVSGAEVVYGVIEADHSSKAPLFTRFHDKSIDRWLERYRGGATPQGELLCTGNVSFRRAAYDAIGGFDRSLVRLEDRDLGIRLELAGHRFAFAGNAISTHRSDHADVGVWRKRSRLYGTSDLLIARKYPQRADLSPWSFLGELPKVVHPLLLVAACAPKTARPLGGLTYALAQGVDRVGKGSAAVKLAGLTYGIDYYSGVGQGWGSAKVALAELKRWKAMR
jgi:GT2 family glycosyltransferase